MAGDLTGYLQQIPIDSPTFDEGLARQTYNRSLNEAAIISVGANGQVSVVRGVNFYDGLIDPSRVAQALSQLKGRTRPQNSARPDRGRLVAQSAGKYCSLARQASEDFREQSGAPTGVERLSSADGTHRGHH